MTFKLKGIPVKVKNGRVYCKDKATRTTVKEWRPFVYYTSPSDGEPLINLLIQVYGRGEVADFEYDDDEKTSFTKLFAYPRAVIYGAGTYASSLLLPPPSKYYFYHIFLLPGILYLVRIIGPRQTIANTKRE